MWRGISVKIDVTDGNIIDLVKDEKGGVSDVGRKDEVHILEVEEGGGRCVARESEECILEPDDGSPPGGRLTFPIFSCLLQILSVISK